MQTITPETLKERLDNGEKLTLVDVRESWEFSICKIEGAVNINMSDSEKLLNDINLTKGDRVSILINSLGATPHEELFIVADKFNNILNDNGIINSKSYVGRYATSMEMAGMSITILKLDDELEKLLLEEANCPFWY